MSNSHRRSILRVEELESRTVLHHGFLGGLGGFGGFGRLGGLGFGLGGLGLGRGLLSNSSAAVQADLAKIQTDRQKLQSDTIALGPTLRQDQQATNTAIANSTAVQA